MKLLKTVYSNVYQKNLYYNIIYFMYLLQFCLYMKVYSVLFK